jgi:hypothetical protein
LNEDIDIGVIDIEDIDTAAITNTTDMPVCECGGVIDCIDIAVLKLNTARAARSQE